MTKIQEGIGDKVGTFLQWFSSFVTGFVIGFVYGWKLTLVILAVSPFLAGAAGLFSKVNLLLHWLTCRGSNRPKWDKSEQKLLK